MTANPNFLQVEIEERGVKLRLTVVDTPGFGDTIDNANSHEEIIRYIDQQVGNSLLQYTHRNKFP